MEATAVLCLAGPASEKYFVGKFDDGGDEGDCVQAREVLARRYDAMQIGAALTRYRDATDSLVRTSWAKRIETIAAALLARGSLSDAEIGGLG
jgi:hypothetical protein